MCHYEETAERLLNLQMVAALDVQVYISWNVIRRERERGKMERGGDGGERSSFHHHTFPAVARITPPQSSSHDTHTHVDPITQL